MDCRTIGLNLPCSEELGIEVLADALLGFGEEMTVAVEGGLYGSMAELRLDEFGVSSLGDEQRGVGMPKVVEPDLPETCSGEGRFKLSADQVSVLQGCSLRGTKNEVMRTCWALNPVDLQRFLQPGRHDDGPLGTFGFGGGEAPKI